MGKRLPANQLYPIVGSLNPSVRPVIEFLDTLGADHRGAQLDYERKPASRILHLLCHRGSVIAGHADRTIVGAHPAPH